MGRHCRVLEKNEDHSNQPLYSSIIKRRWANNAIRWGGWSRCLLLLPSCLHFAEHGARQHEKLEQHHSLTLAFKCVIYILFFPMHFAFSLQIHLWWFSFHSWASFAPVTSFFFFSRLSVRDLTRHLLVAVALFFHHHSSSSHFLYIPPPSTYRYYCFTSFHFFFLIISFSIYKVWCWRISPPRRNENFSFHAGRGRPTAWWVAALVLLFLFRYSLFAVAHFATMRHWIHWRMRTEAAKTLRYKCRNNSHHHS